MGRAAGGPLDPHRRVRAGRRGRPEGRHAREDVRRIEGDGPARVRGPVDHRPDPRRPGDGRADRHPDGGLLPLDRVGPPLRAQRPVARRGRPAGPSPGVDQRRRPRDQPGPQEARQGAPRPGHARRPEPRPAQGRREGRRGRPCRGRPGRAGARPARARSRRPLERPRPPDRRRDRAGRAPEHAREGPPGRARRPRNATPPRSATSATARPSTSPPRWPSWTGSHPTPHPLPVLKTGVERLRTLDGRIRELRAALSGEIEVTFDLAPEPTWRPLSRVSLALVAIGILLAGGPGRPRVPRGRRAGHRRSRRSARSSRSSASSSPRSPCGSAAA